MFHWDNGLFLTKANLAVDVRRRQKFGFISHAHADHVAPHQLALCTPATAELYRHRRGKNRRTKLLPYFEPSEFGPLRLTTLPAGHCLGSAMLLAENGETSLLYTGDFKLGPSATSEQATVVQADVLVMECTFGLPRYRLPPREETVAELVTLVQQTIERDHTPVIHAYALGKSQEVTRLLTRAGIPVQQHPQIFAVSEIYEQCGMELGRVSAYGTDPLPGHAVVTLPRGVSGFRLAGIEKPVGIAVTGWAMDTSTKYRLGVDHALPLSDHADFDQLLEFAHRVKAREIYCLHGPREFAEHLRAEGLNASPIVGHNQLRMF